MLEEPWIFLGILVISLVLENFITERHLGGFYPIVIRLFFIGTFVHEIAHYTMSLAVGHIPKGIEVKWRDEQTLARNPHGSISPSRPLSFLQSFVIALAPLYISTWLIFLLLQVILNPSNDPAIIILAFFIGISLLFCASPSTADFNNIPLAFRKDPIHSCYQIFLILISGCILWIIIVSTSVVFFLDVFYYLSIAGIYLALKFTLIGARKVITKIITRDFHKARKIHFKRLTRKRYKPKKPPKLR